jgi:hypothetical protein
MPSLQTPSPLLGTFVRSARKSFPSGQSALLDGHAEAIGRTTSEPDHRRARHCALWAIEKADDRNQAHPRWHEIKELHQIWKDTWFGVEFGWTGPAGHLEPLEDVRIQWVENAVAVAARLGEEDGWDKSPWEALLVDLIEMEESKAT